MEESTFEEFVKKANFYIKSEHLEKHKPDFDELKEL